jgi:hypothetical protein
MEPTRCPSCESVAAVERLTVVHRHGGEVTYATVRCVLGHWLSTPLEHLPSPPTAFGPRLEVSVR